MNSLELGDKYDELCTFANVKYTPAWYYKKFSGFYNVECYRILAGRTQGVRKESQKENKKRKMRVYKKKVGLKKPVVTVRMVFTDNSNEHTLKVVLRSRLCEDNIHA